MTTDTTTEDTVVLLPEVRVPASTKQLVDDIRRIVDELRPTLTDLEATANKLRDARDLVLISLLNIMSLDEAIDITDRHLGIDDILNEPAMPLGGGFNGGFYDGLYNAMCDGMRNHELKRGGERDLRPGTVSDIEDPDGNPVRVVIHRVPVNGGEQRYFVMKVGEQATPGAVGYLADHEELKAGMVTSD